MADSTCKTCCTCRETKPLAEFGKDRQTPDGLQRRCKPCKNAQHVAYRAANKERLAEYGRQWSKANRDKRNSYTRKWRDGNRGAYLEGKARYREENADLIRAWRAANREQRNEYMRAWRAANPERALEISRRSLKVRYERNPHAFIEAEHRRRALILERTVGTVDLEALWAEQEGRCGLCGDPIDRSLRWPHPMSKSLDHIVPLAKGGTHEQSNLQWTHLVENLQKGASVPT